MKSGTSSIKAVFEIIRWKNIAIAIGTLVIINLALAMDPFSCAAMYDYQFALIIIVVACIMAVGNVHNDLCDIQIDTVNQPSRAIVNGKISWRNSWNILWFALILGFISVSFMAWLENIFVWIGYYCIAILILYFYNIRLKCIALIGNIVVAGLCAAIVLIPMYFHLFNWTDVWTPACSAIRLLPAFAWLAFIVNLIREIIKDLEDVEGDGAHGCNTMPVFFGESFSRYFVYLLSIALFISIAIWGNDYLGTFAPWIQLVILFILIAPFVPFLWSFVRTKNYKSSQHWLKLELLGGLLIYLIASMI